MGSKKRAQGVHARDAFDVRYGIRLTQELHAKLVKDIQTGIARFIDKQSHRVSVFVVLHDNVEVPVVYDKDRKQIVTALPPCCINPQNIGVYISELWV